MAQHYVPTGTDDDNSCTFTIPIDGRPDPVTVTAPKFGWIAPKHVEAYNKWVESLFKKAQEWDDWAKTQVDKDGDPLPPAKWSSEPPHPESEVRADTRRMQLQWLKPYMKAPDFKALVENCSTAQAQWIYDRMNDKPLDGEVEAVDRIEPGESKASADS